MASTIKNHLVERRRQKHSILPQEGISKGQETILEFFKIRKAPLLSLSPRHQSILQILFSEEEIDQTVHQMSPWKSPELDGIPTKFYKQY